MAISASIIPGKVFEEGEAVNISTLNLLGNPTVNIEGAVGTLGLEDDSITDAKVNSVAAIATAKLALSSAIEVDGANVGIGGTAKTKLDVIVSAVTGYSSVQNDGIVIERGGATAALNIATDNNQQGAIWFADGDAANSGQIIYDHADDSLQLGTAATEAMRITSDGNCGIGTDDPAAEVEARGSLFLTTNSTTADEGQSVYFQTTTSGWNTGSAHGAISGKRTDGSNGYLTFSTRGSGTIAERMRIASDGEVKVVGTGQSRSYTSVAGTRLTLEDTNPNITILGSETSESSRILFAAPSNQNEGTIGYSNNSDYMWFETDDTERMRISADGNIGIGCDPSTPLHIQSANTTGGMCLIRNTAGTAADGSSVLEVRSDDASDIGAHDLLNLNNQGNIKMLVQADGVVIIPSMPTSDPGVAGALFSDGAAPAGGSATLKISGGPA